MYYMYYTCATVDKITTGTELRAGPAAAADTCRHI